MQIQVEHQKPVSDWERKSLTLTTFVGGLSQISTGHLEGHFAIYNLITNGSLSFEDNDPKNNPLDPTPKPHSISPADPMLQPLITSKDAQEYLGAIRNILSAYNIVKRVSNGAWVIKNVWNSEFIKQYQAFAPKQAQLYLTSGTRFTCEDLALQIIIDFASQNGLNVKIETGVGVFDVSDSKWNGNIKNFTGAVQQSTKALDLQRSANTTGISLSDVSLGDIMVQANDRGGIGHHIQMVIGLASERIFTVQGGISRGFFKWTGSPLSNLGYYGSELNASFFNTTTGNFFSGRINQINPNFLKTYQYKRWKFYNFN